MRGVLAMDALIHPSYTRTALFWLPIYLAIKNHIYMLIKTLRNQPQDEDEDEYED